MLALVFNNQQLCIHYWEIQNQNMLAESIMVGSAIGAKIVGLLNNWI